MGRKSIIDRLSADRRGLIKQLRDDGRTIDEIATHLHGMGVPISRSALGLHVRSLDLASEAGLANELLRQRKAINGLARRMAELGAAIERLVQIQGGEGN